MPASMNQPLPALPWSSPSRGQTVLTSDKCTRIQNGIRCALSHASSNCWKSTNRAIDLAPKSNDTALMRQQLLAENQISAVPFERSRQYNNADVIVNSHAEIGGYEAKR